MAGRKYRCNQTLQRSVMTLWERHYGALITVETSSSTGAPLTAATAPRIPAGSCAASLPIRRGNRYSRWRPSRMRLVWLPKISSPARSAEAARVCARLPWRRAGDDRGIDGPDREGRQSGRTQVRPGRKGGIGARLVGAQRDAAGKDERYAPCAGRGGSFCVSCDGVHAVQAHQSPAGSASADSWQPSRNGRRQKRQPIRRREEGRRSRLRRPVSIPIDGAV